MSLNYKNLDEPTRKLMLDELQIDEGKGILYLSNRLSEPGLQQYPRLLKTAIEDGNDGTLEASLSKIGIFNATFPRKKPSGGYSEVKMPSNAAQTLAEGEFNRFYIRGICRVAIEANTNEVLVYRAKEVKQPRPGSEEMIGQSRDAEKLLEDLRSSIGVDTALGLPQGPNSGLSVHLP